MEDVNCNDCRAGVGGNAGIVSCIPGFDAGDHKLAAVARVPHRDATLYVVVDHSDATIPKDILWGFGGAPQHAAEVQWRPGFHDLLLSSNYVGVRL